jgi:Helix-turn-helix domain
MRQGDSAKRSSPDASLRVGEPFNPFGLFNGIFIPEALMRAKSISPGAKLTYERLARYAGHDGNCYPSLRTLASEIGAGVRQVQRYAAELEKARFVRRIARVSEAGLSSNLYEFLSLTQPAAPVLARSSFGP